MLKRKDLQIISELIEPNSRVLDLGCGDGTLLNELIKKKEISGLGIEISLEQIKKCLEMGLSVVQEDLNEGLKDLQDFSFDYVILSQTLGHISKPIKLLLEMARVGKNSIVSFENIAYWRNRLSFLFKGYFSKKTTNDFSGKQQFLTINRFFQLCKLCDLTISLRILLPKKMARIFPNLFCKTAIFTFKARARNEK